MPAVSQIRDLVHTVRERLSAVSDTPRLEAELLVSRAIDMPRSYVFAHPEDELDEAALGRLAGEVKRRLTGEPLAYITGRKEFWSLELLVTPDTLVPRPETERLVELALAEIAHDSSCRVLDLGTGSGAIACALAHERRMTEVTAVDISSAALAVARQNARQLELDNLRFLEGSWVKPVIDEEFDLVVSNPPYVAENDVALQLLEREPASALVSRGDELGCLKTLARKVPQVLADGGIMLVEHGSAQNVGVHNLLSETGWTDIECFTDFAGLPRVTRARRGTF
ncbi:MAG: peptide chain release factor N(5)-glutamine methyltransferase [Pseudomonadota bacterium]